MAITVVDYGDGSSTSAASTVVADNAAMQADDLRIVCIAISNNTITTPAGWTLITVDVVASTRRIYWFRRAHPGAGETSHTFAFSAASNHSVTPFAMRGHDTTTPIDVSTLVASATSGTAVAAPSITTLTPGAVLLTSHHKFTLGASNTMPLPTGMTSIGTGAGNGSVGQAFRVAYEHRPTFGVTGTRTSTSSNSVDGWGASALAIRPASASPPLPGNWLRFFA